MQLIADLEAVPRGVYCGAVGYLAPPTDSTDAQAVFNVPIRTLVLAGDRDGMGTGTMGSGSGIVWDSDPEAEYDECQLKAQLLRRAWAWPDRPLETTQQRYIAEAGPFSLLETMRAEHVMARDAVVELQVDDEALAARVEKRAAESGGAVREDDTVEALRNRLKVYHNQTAPLIGFYAERGKLVSVDGMQDITAVSGAIAKLLTEASGAGLRAAG